jgi:hypothetical protein
MRAVTPTYPSVDESHDRLHRAGWCDGEVATPVEAKKWQAERERLKLAPAPKDR